MTQPLRNTPYARELVVAKLPAGGKNFVAIERIHVKRAKQDEIRFSSWQGSKLQPRALDLPEQDLLPLLDTAIQAGVFSETFLDALRRLLDGSSEQEDAASEAPSGDLERVQAHFHGLIRDRAGDRLGRQAPKLPRLSREATPEAEPGWFPVEGMDGGFKYWWDAAAPTLRLMSESWSRTTAGSGQLHEITPAGSRLLGEGFI